MNKFIFLCLGLFVLFGSYFSNPVEFVDETPFLIGSFNLKNYGQTKAGRPEFLDVVVRVISKYDIALLQEIQDATEKIALPTLLKALNEHVKGANITYAYKASPRLGFESRKEQYAFFYRQTTKDQQIKIVKDFVFSNEDLAFERPPHTAKFKVTNSKKLSKIREFYLSNVHIRPEHVYTEALAYNSVLDDIVKVEGLTDPANYNVAIIGDYNFGCSYISAKRKEEVRAALSRFTWFISDNNPTTISSSGCAYDRILLSGNKLKSAIFPNSNGTYRYDLEFGLNEEQTADISDHYPIEFQLY